MEEPPDESLNHENTAQTSDNQKTKTEGAGQALHKGSDHAGVGSSEPSGDKVSGQAANAGSRQTDRRTSEEAEQRLPGHAERKASQQAERRLSERRTSQQRPSLSEGRAFGKIDGQASLPSGRKASDQAGQETSEQDDLISSDDADYLSGKGQRQVNSQAGYWTEDSRNQQRLSQEIEKEYTQVRHTEKQAGYRSYYKTLAHIESRSLTDIHDTREADHRVQPCTFEESETELRSKVSTTEETESATTLPTYNPHDTELTTDTQSSHEKLPSITTKVYYSSSPEKIKTTEFISDVTTEFEQRKNSQRGSQSYRRRFPPIVYDDPYQIALCYMEKHNILQVFQQITENLVYEMPDDPLRFMLDQKVEVRTISLESTCTVSWIIVGKRCRELDSGPLKAQRSLFTAEPSLQHQDKHSFLSYYLKKVRKRQQARKTFAYRCNPFSRCQPAGHPLSSIFYLATI
ncbi:testis-specific expressed protein 55 [Apodemus sylvaticus]|uniref:testis-specific expressed protein 55 n=1 Tax=Apodemus sylvaticus TaxID=10129 RepID=UPI002242D286|nr:testis-specific expressed protein 55 [Apodemus sylvaticus]